MTKACAVCAVKGGVGKTLISINVAKRLSEMEQKVGLIDCDLDNSNFAQFTNTDAVIEVDPRKGFKPYNWLDNIQVFSMSLIAGREKSVSMTGDRYAQMIDDIVSKSMWDCDYFILDLPSGSGDIFQVVMEIFADKLAGNIIVTQPAMVDASKRVINLHKYFDIPILGLIENMSHFSCPHHKNPKTFYPFGESVVEDLAKEYGLEVLGTIPLSEDIPKNIKDGKPFLTGDLAIPIESACKKLMEAKVQKTGLLERIRAKITEGIKGQVEKVLAFLIIAINKEVDVGGIKSSTGLTEERPFYLVITDETGRKEITSLALRIKGNKLIMLTKPKEVDFEISSSFRTFARMIMGKKKVGGKIVNCDPMDFWLHGDVKTYGRGYAPRAVHVFRTIFGNEQFMADVRKRYGSLLEKWI